MEVILQKALKLLLDQFGAEYDAVGVIDDNGHYRVNIETTNTGALIGKHGSILLALEALLKHIIWEQTGEKVFFSVDVDNYRKNKDDKVLEDVDKRIEFMKEKSLPEFRFKPMKPYTRRLVHLYIMSKYPELTTESTGDGQRRAIVVQYK